MEQELDRHMSTVEINYVPKGVPDAKVQGSKCTTAYRDEVKRVTAVFFEEHSPKSRCDWYTAYYRARSIGSYRTHTCERIAMNEQTMPRSHVNMTASQRYWKASCKGWIYPRHEETGHITVRIWTSIQRQETACIVEVIKIDI